MAQGRTIQKLGKKFQTEVKQQKMKVAHSIYKYQRTKTGTYFSSEDQINRTFHYSKNRTNWKG